MLSMSAQWISQIEPFLKWETDQLIFWSRTLELHHLRERQRQRKKKKKENKSLQSTSLRPWPDRYSTYRQRRKKHGMLSSECTGCDARISSLMQSDVRSQNEANGISSSSINLATRDWSQNWLRWKVAWSTSVNLLCVLRNGQSVACARPGWFSFWWTGIFHETFLIAYDND